MGEGEWRVQGNFTVQSDTKISLLSLQCLFRIEIQDDRQYGKNWNEWVGGIQIFYDSSITEVWYTVSNTLY